MRALFIVALLGFLAGCGDIAYPLPFDNLQSNFWGDLLKWIHPQPDPYVINGR